MSHSLADCTSLVKRRALLHGGSNPSTSPNFMKNLTNEQLERILITSDGKGREVKREALAELMARIEEDAFEKGKEVMADRMAYDVI